MAGDPVTAQDVVRDAFLGPHRRWARLRDPATAPTYVRSTRNVVHVDLTRRAPDRSRP